MSLHNRYDFVLVFDVRDGWNRCAPSSAGRFRMSPSPAPTTARISGTG